MSNLENGSVVWVRLGQAWWPGTITTLEKCPPEFVEGLRKDPIAVVKFFHENEFQDIHKEEHIYPYSCDRKEEFIRRGLYINKNQSHGDVDLLQKFEADVVTAEKLTGGDMDILQTIGEVAEIPPNMRSSSAEMGYTSNSQSVILQRPQGSMPGVIELGKAEGQTQIVASNDKMRSPLSNSEQQSMILTEASTEQICDSKQGFSKEEVVLMNKQVVIVDSTQSISSVEANVEEKKLSPREGETKKRPIYSDKVDSLDHIQGHSSLQNLADSSSAHLECYRKPRHKDSGLHGNGVLELSSTTNEPCINSGYSNTGQSSVIQGNLPIKSIMKNNNPLSNRMGNGMQNNDAKPSLNYADELKIKYSRSSNLGNGSDAGSITEVHNKVEKIATDSRKEPVPQDSGNVCDVEESGLQVADQSSNKKTSCVKEMHEVSDSDDVVTSSGVKVVEDEECNNAGVDLEESGDKYNASNRSKSHIHYCSLESSTSKERKHESESVVDELNTPSKDKVSRTEEEINDGRFLNKTNNILQGEEEAAIVVQSPKRKRELSLQKNKRKKAENHPAEEEEEELPDLAAIVNAERRKPRLNQGDLVWVKYRKDWWPSYIKNAYPKERKFSIYFIACEQKSGIKIGTKNVQKLYIFDVPSFVNQNQEGFSAALHLCKLYHKLKGAGNTICAHDFFSMSPQDQVALLNPEKSVQNTEKIKPERKLNQFKAECSASLDITAKPAMSPRDMRKLESALKARKTDNIKLVKYMKSPECLEHLWNIFNEKTSCKRHEDYQDMNLRKDLLWSGIGPFQLDEDDEQIMSVIDIMREEIKSKRPDYSNGADYAFRVWMPEAIKEALRVVKKVPESKLEEAMNKGYGETLTEKKARRLCF